MTEHTPGRNPAGPSASDSGPSAADNFGGERWGWELRTPESPDPTPFEEQPPGPGNLTAGWSRRLAASRNKVEPGWYPHVRRWAGVLVLGAAAWLSGLLPAPYGGYVSLVLWLGTLLLVFLAIRPLLLPFYGDLRYQRWRQRVLDGQRQVEVRSREWAARRREHRQWADAQAKPERWTPLRPMTTQRVDVYGGDPPGAEALLLSVASSILAGGNPVTVADFSQDGVCHALVQRAYSERRDVFAAMLPNDLQQLGLLDGLTSEDVGSVVAEAVHVSERDRSAGGDRTLDTTLMDQVAGCLEGPLSFTRLHRALTALTQETRPEGVDREEYGRLRQLMGADARKAMEGRLFRLSAALQRLSAMEPLNVQTVAQGEAPVRQAPIQQAPIQQAAVQQAPTQHARVRQEPAQQADGPAAAPGAHPRSERAQLVVWDLSERVGDVGGELLAHVGFQVLQHRLRQDRIQSGRTLILLGADRFRRSHLERLDQLARRRGVRLVCFFRHLREDSVEVLGGGEAVVFMRLGNAKEAEAAATFIGRDHRLVLSQFTVQHSSSLSNTVGTSDSESTGENQSVTKGRQWSRTRSHQYGASTSFPHDNRSENRGTQTSTSKGTSVTNTTGTSESQQTGTSESRSAGYQRVYEFVVEPRFLQSLASTSFILVDPRDPGSPRIGDSSPELDDQMYSLVKGDQVNPAAAVAQATGGRTSGLGGLSTSGTVGTAVGNVGAGASSTGPVPQAARIPTAGTEAGSGAGPRAAAGTGTERPAAGPGVQAETAELESGTQSRRSAEEPPAGRPPAGPPGSSGQPGRSNQPAQPNQPAQANRPPQPEQPAEESERKRNIAAPGSARPPAPY